MNRSQNITLLMFMIILTICAHPRPKTPNFKEMNGPPGMMNQQHSIPFSRDMPNSNNQETTTTGNNNNNNKQKSNFMIWILLFFLCLITFAYMRKRQIWIIKDIFMKEMNKFQQLALAKPLKSSDKQKEARSMAIKQKNYIMVNKFADPLQNFKTEMNLARIEKVKDRLYEIKYECKDINGVSSCQGLIALITTKELSIKLIKIYSKYTHMGQKIKKQKRIIFYQGKGSLNHITGKWYYYGFQNEQNSKGEFQMN